MDSFKWINRDCVDGEQRKRKKKRKRLQELGRMVEKQLFFGFALGVCVCSILLAPTSPFCLFPSSFPSPSPPPSFDLGEDIGKWSEERKGGFLSMGFLSFPLSCLSFSFVHYFLPHPLSLPINITEQHRGGEMQMAWQTPILKVNVADFGVKDVEKMNKMLTTSIKRAYLKVSFLSFSFLSVSLFFQTVTANNNNFRSKIRTKTSSTLLPQPSPPIKNFIRFVPCPLPPPFAFS